MASITLLLFIVSWLAYGIVLVAALTIGGAPERIGAFAFASGVALSWISYRHDGSAFRTFEPGLACVDLALLAVLLCVARYSFRWWPICAAAAQLIACLAHLVKLLDPATTAGGYSQMESSSTVPLLLAIGGGTVLHYRRRGTARGVDPSWNRSLPTAARAILVRLRLG
jgi:hypothetical protein